MKIIVSDVDDVLADLVFIWLKLYNADFKENIKKSDITEWDIGSFLKYPNNRKYLYEYIENPSIYDKIKPIKDSLWGINKLRSFGYRVIFVTSSTLGQTNRKYQWLKDYGFIDNRKDYFEAIDKSVFNCEYMVDDKFDNVINCNGKGILFEQNWNKKEIWGRKCNGWKEVINLISLEQS